MVASSRRAAAARARRAYLPGHPVVRTTSRRSLRRPGGAGDPGRGDPRVLPPAAARPAL